MSIHLVDRSRYVEGLSRCLRKRYLEYHAGPQHTGLKRKAHSLPLITGSAVHKAHELAFRGLPLDEAIAQVQKSYRSKVEKRGIFADAFEGIVEEQCCLIEGLVRGAFRLVWPSILEEYSFLSVEQEQDYILDCSCGLADGAGSYADHAGRGCNGIDWMSSPDLILRHKERRSLAYFELKTTAEFNRSWKMQWENNVQIAANVAGAELKLGEQVAEYFVLGFRKGRREAPYDPDYGFSDEQLPQAQAKEQQSPFTYCYFSPGSPPLVKPQWRDSREYWDDTPSRYQKGKPPGPKGFRHTLTKDFQRVPVWGQRFAEELIGTELAEQSPSKLWSEKLLSEEVLKKQYMLCGPYQRPSRLVERFFRQVIGHEREWQARLAAVYEAEKEGAEELEAALDHVVPPSWDCHRYFQECPFIPICHEQAAASDPLGSDEFVERRPHHAREVEVLEASGVKLPPDEEEEEES